LRFLRLFGFRFHHRDYGGVIIGLLFGLRRQWNLDFDFAFVNIVVNLNRFLIRVEQRIGRGRRLLGFVGWPVGRRPEGFFREPRRIEKRTLFRPFGILARFLW
jgi:hypothetical protein